MTACWLLRCHPERSAFRGAKDLVSKHLLSLLSILCFVFTFSSRPAFAQNSAAPPNSPANNSAALPAAWANWKYSRVINLPSDLPSGVPATSSSASSERLVKLRLPADIFAHVQPDLADLRIIDDLGAQTPYVLRIASGRTQTAIIRSRQLESSYVPSQYTQIILDAGARAPFYNSLEVATPLQNFAAWARVEASDDARTWRQLGKPEPIYRFAQKNSASELTLDFSPTNARYLRLRIFYKPAKFEVSGVSIRHAVSIPREDVSVATISDVSAAQQNGRTILHADLRYQMPVDRVRITSSLTDFDRTVQIYSSDDDAHWNWTGYGEINAFASRLPPSPEELAAGSGTPDVLPGAMSPHATLPDAIVPDAIVPDAIVNARRDASGHYDRLACNFASRPARYWRVEIVNGNDAPLPNASAQLSFAARDVFFRAEPGRSYSLIYGQSMLHGEPHYDLARTLSDAQMDSAAVAAAQTAVGPERANSAWVDPRPWSERHSIVLWLAVIVAALALTFLAIQSLKQSKVTSDPSQ